MNKSYLRILLEKQSFGSNAKVAKLLDKNLSTDMDLAKAALTTKAYKENAEVKKTVDNVIAGVQAEEPKAPETKTSTSTRGGERRGGY